MTVLRWSYLWQNNETNACKHGWSGHFNQNRLGMFCGLGRCGIYIGSFCWPWTMSPSNENECGRSTGISEIVRESISMFINWQLSISSGQVSFKINSSGQHYRWPICRGWFYWRWLIAKSNQPIYRPIFFLRNIEVCPVLDMAGKLLPQSLGGRKSRWAKQLGRRSFFGCFKAQRLQAILSVKFLLVVKNEGWNFQVFDPIYIQLWKGSVVACCSHVSTEKDTLVE